jgi:hypothetical protein
VLILGGLVAIAYGAFWPLAMRLLQARFYGSGAQRTWSAKVSKRMLPVRQYLGAAVVCLAGLALIAAGVEGSSMMRSKVRQGCRSRARYWDWRSRVSGASPDWQTAVSSLVVREAQR